ncbi:MAG: ATPase domain-containing protein [Candidatus Nanohaloarchaea archaeon]
MTTSADDLDVVPLAPGDSPDELTFRIENTAGQRVHDVVKCYVDSSYAGYEYVDVEQSESEDVSFSLSRTDISPDSRVVLTTSTRQDGVLLDTSFADVRDMAVDAAETESEAVTEEHAPSPDAAGQPSTPDRPRPGEPGEGDVEQQPPTSAADSAAHRREPRKTRETQPSQEPQTTAAEENGQTVEEPGETPRQTESSGRVRQPDDVETGGAVQEAETPPQSMPVDRVIDEPAPGHPEDEGGVLSSIASSLFHREDEGAAEPAGEQSQPEPADEETEEQAGEEAEGEQGDREEPGRDTGRPAPSEQVDRLTTGIINLDDKMQGGFVDGTMNLVTGKTGTGKTAFSASFIKEGVDQGQRGVYVTTEERKEDIQADIQAMFGWDFSEYEEENMVRVMSIKPIFPSKEIENLNRLVRSYITDLLNQVKQAIEELDADRVVIDSVSIIEMFIRDEYMARVALSKLLNSLREEQVTAVLTGGIPETSEGLSGGGIIEYLVDTVILLEFVPVAEEHKRTLTIRKMRRTDHDVDIFPLEITPRGMEIQSVEDSPL